MDGKYVLLNQEQAGGGRRRGMERKGVNQYIIRFSQALSLSTSRSSGGRGIDAGCVSSKVCKRGGPGYSSPSSQVVRLELELEPNLIRVKCGVWLIR